MLYYVNVEFNKECLSIKENQITLGIKSKPIKGEANKEIIKNSKTLSNISIINSNKIRT